MNIIVEYFISIPEYPNYKDIILNNNKTINGRKASKSPHETVGVLKPQNSTPLLKPLCLYKKHG